jgi:hypothetical protein
LALFSCPGGEVWPIIGTFELVNGFLACLSLFLALFDIPLNYVLSSMTMGRGKIGV